MSSAALRVLLAELIDYAGLFPPAACSMADAVQGYASYRASLEAWALGRFVVPVARLDELATAATSLQVDGIWHVSALLGSDVTKDVSAIRAWNERHRGQMVVDVAEVRASTVEAIAAASGVANASLVLYVEIPAAEDPTPLVAEIAKRGLRAKIRTGGIEASAFPDARDIARFVLRCVDANVAFKATAGLHHPIRADQRFTYADDAPRGTMFGFLNVFIAAAFARAAVVTSVGELSEILEEIDVAAFTLSDDAIRWRDLAVTIAALAGIRERFAIAFGSCSFLEPIEDLQRLHLL